MRRESERGPLTGPAGGPSGGPAGPPGLASPWALGSVLRPRTPLAVCGRIKLNSDRDSCCGRRFSLLFLSSCTVRPSRARWVGWSVSP